MKIDFPKEGPTYNIEHALWIICRETCGTNCIVHINGVKCNILKAKKELKELKLKVEKLEQQLNKET